MNKRIIAIIGSGLLIIICLMLYRPGKDEQSMSDKPSSTSVPLFANTLPSNTSTASQLQSQASDAAAGAVLVPRNAKIDSNGVTSAPRPEFVWYTQPTSKGAIKNSRGEIIFQATDEMPFVSMRSRANVSRIVVFSGNRNAFVIDPETKQRVSLPKQPPVEGAKGFETWEWVDNDTLLAEYHVPAKAEVGKTVSCCQGHSIAETILYTYSLKSNALVKVVLPKQLQGTAFSIGRIAGDGSFELVTPSNHLADGKGVGWFDLSANR
jgi:hypothetical protein